MWGGQHERPVYMALVSPTPQELIEYFFIWKSLNPSAALLMRGS
ncbi:hypothetical protein GXM_03689 [Nostoc sphaeroides CCNUC1]|uniref:Uncharacterized protein n=1 Tax=Nostoc sphaeroides CCNUC1 TaxID=2653204 RepID=A0A5P8W2H1_9NOSO|nr:hypothetical protein GXM_03689 [Nostoc sphaeroides CCNUC1]